MSEAGNEEKPLLLLLNVGVKIRKKNIETLFFSFQDDEGAAVVLEHSPQAGHHRSRSQDAAVYHREGDTNHLQ